MNDKYVIGEGHFGTVYYAQLKESIFPFAIKVNKRHSFEFLNELRILSLLNEVKGVPNIIATVNENCKDLIVQDLCGPSLDKLHYFCGNKFSEETVLSIGI